MSRRRVTRPSVPTSVVVAALADTSRIDISGGQRVAPRVVDRVRRRRFTAPDEAPGIPVGPVGDGFPAGLREYRSQPLDLSAVLSPVRVWIAHEQPLVGRRARHRPPATLA